MGFGQKSEKSESSFLAIFCNFALDFWGALVGDCRYEYSGCDTLTDYRNEGTVALFMFMGFVSILSSAFIFLGFAEGLKHLRHLRNK